MAKLTPSPKDSFETSAGRLRMSQEPEEKLDYEEFIKNCNFLIAVDIAVKIPTSCGVGDEV